MKDLKDKGYQSNDNKSNSKPNQENNKDHAVMVTDKPESTGKSNQDSQNKKGSDTGSKSHDTESKSSGSDKQRAK